MILTITCLLFRYLILSCQARSTAVHLLQNAKSCLFWDALLHVGFCWEMFVRRLVPHLLGGINLVILRLISLLMKAFLPAWWQLTGCISTLCTVVCEHQALWSMITRDQNCKPCLIDRICTDGWDTRVQTLHTKQELQLTVVFRVKLYESYAMAITISIQLTSYSFSTVIIREYLLEERRFIPPSRVWDLNAVCQESIKLQHFSLICHSSTRHANCIQIQTIIKLTF